MRIAIFVTAAYCRKKFLQAVSGHVQIPLMAARILMEAGHNVSLITTRPESCEVLPEVAPKELFVYDVNHASGIWPDQRVYLGKAAKQVWQLANLLKKQNFDVVHFFGATKTGLMLCVIKHLGTKSSSIFTPIKQPPLCTAHGIRGRLFRAAFGRIDRIVATADYVADGWRRVCKSERVSTLRPGITKRNSTVAPGAKRNSVLFWRNAGYKNGVDIAITTFNTLAPKYPDVRFVFAVRPNDQFESELLELERAIPNIDVHIYPYGNGVSLASLLNEALFVVQPFRSISLNPQMSILETLYSGVPVVTTNIESNGEVVQDGCTGVLVPPNNEDVLTSTTAGLLDNRELLMKLREKANIETSARWNWDLFREGLLKVYDGIGR
jgi:glycosyltransferase involved in cell wall biosynthesis